MLKIAIFLAASAGILVFSWKSIRDPRVHGFYRFFAFELLVILILLNVDNWFTEVLSPVQIISWILLLCSMFLAIHGFWLLRYIGKPKGDFENTTELVMVGAYKFIRHPLYASLLLLGWGAFFKDSSVPALVIALTLTLFLVLTARTEEGENLKRFGATYAEYMKSTRMFIPYLL